MSNFKFTLKKFLDIESSIFGQKRIIWDVSKPETGPTAAPKEGAPPVSLDTNIDNKAFKDAKEQDIANQVIFEAFDKIVDSLADMDGKVKELLKGELKNGLRNALVEAQKANGAIPTNSDDFTRYIRQTLKVSKIKLQHDPARDKLTLRMFTAENKEVFITQDNVPIRFEVVAQELREKIVPAETNPMYGKEQKVTIANKRTILGELAAKAQDGDILNVKRGVATYNEARGTMWHAKLEKGKFVYTDGPVKGRELGTAAAPLIQEDEITLLENPDKVQARQIKGGNLELTLNGQSSQYEVIGLRTIDMAQNESYFDIAQKLLNEYPAIKATNISTAEYADLLRQAHEKTGKGPQIPIIKPTAFAERRTLLQRETEEAQRRVLTGERQAAQEQQQGQVDQLRGDALRQGRRMFIENRTIHRDQLKALVDDPNTWKRAWENPDAMPGIAPLINILKSEPIFRQVSTDPNAFRDRIREAIANGNEKQLDIEDIINFVLKGVRMPALGAPAQRIQEGQGVIRLDKWQDPEGNNSGRMRIAAGFLKALGPDAVQSAHVIEYESDDKVKIKFNYQGNCYVVKLNYDSGDNADSNVEVYDADGKKMAYSDYGYNNKFDIDNRDLLGSTATVKNTFDNAVRPRLGMELTYNPTIGQGLKGFYLLHYNTDGTPKTSIHPALKQFFDDTIVGTTRMLDASTRLNLNQQALVTEQREERQNVPEWGKIRHNNSVDNPDKNFNDLVRDKDAFRNAWLQGKIKGQSQIMEIIGSEPVFESLRSLPPAEFAERFRLAIYNGSAGSLDAADIYNILLGDRPFNGRRFNEGFAVSSDLKGKLNEYFDDNGPKKIEKPTPEQQKDIDYCINFVKGASRLLRVYATMSPGAGYVSSEKAFYSAYMQQQDRKIERDSNIEKDPNRDNYAVYNIEDLVKYQNAPGITSIGIQKAGNLTPESAKGIAISRSVTDQFALGEDPTGQKPLLALKNIIRMFGFEQLVGQGHIKKTANTKGVEFYVLSSIPQMPPGVKTSVGTMLQSGKDVSQEMVDVINPQTKLRKTLEKIFPLEDRPDTMADVTSGEQRNVETRQGLERRMSYRFANMEFMKMEGVLNPDNTINQARALEYMKGYLESGIRKIVNRYNVTKAVNSWTSLDVQTQLGNGQLEKLLTEVSSKPSITVEELDQYISNPAALFALREGFVKAHDEKSEKERKDVIEGAKARFDKWKTEHPKEVEQIQSNLEKDLKKQNYTDEQIERIKVEALPYFFYAGITGEGFAVGVGVNFALDTGAGTILIGTSIFGTIPAGVGIEAHVGYETPALGPVKFAVFGGAGARVGKEFGVGYGVGAAIPINLNYIAHAIGGGDSAKDTTHYTVAPGILYVPGLEAIGVPLVIPGVTVTFSKDHQARFEECKDVLFKQIGFDKVEAAQGEKAKADAIKANPAMHSLFKKYLGKENPSDAELVKTFEDQKKDLLDQLTQAYDPGWLDSLTVGVGYSPDGKIVFGFGGSFYVGHETVTTAQGTQDLALQNELGLANQLEKQELSRAPRTSSTEFIDSGKRIKVNGVEGTRVSLPVVTKPSEAPRAGEGPVNNREGLINDLNKKLAPLNLSVTWDEGMKMFKLNIENINSNTNYEIAADHAMKTAGLVFKNGQVYLTDRFTDPTHPLTIQRADYNFPVSTQGANYLSIITVSDNPYRGFNDVYMSSPKVIRFQNGVPKNELQDQFGGLINIKNNIYSDPNAPELANLRFEDTLSRQAQRAPDSEEFKKNREKLIISGGNLDQAMLSNGTYEKFASDFLKTHQKEYRQLSNAERNTEQFTQLSALLSQEFEKTNNRKMNDAELNYIRNVLVDLTAVENPDRVKDNMTPAEKSRNAQLRRAKFEEHLNATRETIKTRFTSLIDSYNKKHPDNKITRSAQEIADYVINDIRSGKRGLDQFFKHDQSVAQRVVPLTQIESYEYVAGSMGIRGFRGEIYTKDLANHPEYSMLAASENYIDALRNAPGSWQADYAKIIIESHSAIPQLSATPTFEEAQKLTRSNLGSKVLSAMLGDNTGAGCPDLLGSVALRDALAVVAASNTPLTLFPEQIEAVQKFKSIVEGVRNAQLQGLTSYNNPLNPKYTFKIKRFEAQDGVYNKCTNYSEWLNEDIGIETAGQEIPQYATALAAYNSSTEQIVSQYAQQRQTIAAGVAAVVKVKNQPPPPPPPGEHTGTHVDVGTAEEGGTNQEAGTGKGRVIVGRRGGLASKEEVPTD